MRGSPTGATQVMNDPMQWPEWALPKNPNCPLSIRSSAHQGHHKPDDDHITSVSICSFPITAYPLLSALEGSETGGQVEGRYSKESKSLLSVPHSSHLSRPERTHVALEKRAEFL